MVKTKTKTPTLDSVRKVKSGVTELVLQNQKLKKKCRKLKKKVAKLETTSKKSFRNDEVEKKRATTKALMDKKRLFFYAGTLVRTSLELLTLCLPRF